RHRKSAEGRNHHPHPVHQRRRPFQTQFLSREPGPKQPRSAFRRHRRRFFLSGYSDTYFLRAFPSAVGNRAQESVFPDLCNRAQQEEGGRVARLPCSQRTARRGNLTRTESFRPRAITTVRGAGTFGSGETAPSPAVLVQFPSSGRGALLEHTLPRRIAPWAARDPATNRRALGRRAWSTFKKPAPRVGVRRFPGAASSNPASS